ncbi:hypothetical protein GCM10011380_24240 [Sphingomonas metalli]|uniref:Lipoprotein n=1 Tax=Sphingomonas metalli TaxID=1779358 RepID=A0A916T892_9SPHN|nr:hypothetical protein [Sphingomonas metalli]GGB33946.1 hypothetical protein GCM10011380_24240 [Sphingomonas metalli]
MIARWTTLATGLMLAACSAGSDTAERMNGNGVSLRNLADTEVARDAAERDFRLQGDLIPTPSDTRSRYFLLRERKALGGTIIAILRQEQGSRVAYARAEVDCGKRLFHVLGVGPSRASAEVAIAHDGPLRPIAGLPLREELAGYVCERSGTPLAAA